MNRLQWTHGFEEYLKTMKKGRRIIRDDTLSYYRNLFKRRLEGRKLTRRLVEEVAESEKLWLYYEALNPITRALLAVSLPIIMAVLAQW